MDRRLIGPGHREWKLGRDSFVEFERRFIDRDALEKPNPAAQRKKVSPPPVTIRTEGEIPDTERQYNCRNRHAGETAAANERNLRFLVSTAWIRQWMAGCIHPWMLRLRC